VEQRLRRHRQRIELELEWQAARLRRLEALQRAIASDPGAPELGARVRAIPAAFVLGLRAQVPSHCAPITALFEKAEARAGRERCDASPFLLFHSALDVEAMRSGARLLQGAWRAAGSRRSPSRVDHLCRRVHAKGAAAHPDAASGAPQRTAPNSVLHLMLDKRVGVAFY